MKVFVIIVIDTSEILVVFAVRWCVCERVFVPFGGGGELLCVCVCVFYFMSSAAMASSNAS